MVARAVAGADAAAVEAVAVVVAAAAARLGVACQHRCCSCRVRHPQSALTLPK